MNFLIIYNYDEYFKANEAESPNEALIMLAQDFYDGEVPEYMLKALRANTDSIHNAISLFNIMFQQIKINYMYQISETIYDEDR